MKKQIEKPGLVFNHLSLKSVFSELWSQDMSSSCLPAKYQASNWSTRQVSQSEAWFFGRKPLKFISCLRSQIKLTLVQCYNIFSIFDVRNQKRLDFFFDSEYYGVAVWGRFEIWYTPIDKNQNQSAPYFLFWLMWYIFVSCLCAYLLCSKAH